MKVVVRTAPQGVTSFSLWDDEEEVLTIWVDEGLDPLTRRRYIRQAEREQRIDPKRRRRLASPLLIVGAHRFVWRHKASGAIAAAGAAATAAAVAVGTIAMGPTPPDGNDISTVAQGPPSTAAPAPGASREDPRQAPGGPAGPAAPMGPSPTALPTGSPPASSRPVVLPHPLRSLRSDRPIRKAVALPVKPRDVIGTGREAAQAAGVPPLGLRDSLPRRLLPAVPSAHASP